MPLSPSGFLPWKVPRPAALIALVLFTVLAPLIVAPRVAAQGDLTHVVKPGENLFRIALGYGLTTQQLAAANGIPDPTKIYVGQVLVIPAAGYTPPAADPAPAPAADPAPAPAPAASGVHVVQRGETLASIARLYGTTWPAIASANGIANPSIIYAGQQLIIPAGGTASPATQDLGIIPPAPAADPAPALTGAERTHIVKAGEHLAAIAQAYGLTWPTLAQANNLSNPNQIYAGQMLIIPAGNIPAGSYTPPNTAPSPTISSGKQIIVDLSDQRVYAYENGALVRNVLVSTGTSAYPTVQGDYQIYVKYTSQTMSGPGYYLPGVPWVMYFYRGYSLHGTYWHSNWGTPMSHGCVNMPTPEAEWLYAWAPIGTPVRVQW